MSFIDKGFLMNANLDTRDVKNAEGRSVSFYNTDKNISVLYMKLILAQKGEPQRELQIDEVAGYKINITAIKPKTNQYRIVEGILSDGLVDESCAIWKFELDEEFTNQIGPVACWTKIIDGDKVLNMNSFAYDVNADGLTGLNEEITTNKDLPILEELITKVQKVNNINDIKVSETETYSNKKIEEKFSGVNAQFNTIENKTSSKNEVDIERKRIDSFTSLAEGSTTGDAELIDGRIGADSVIYKNIGGAIRTQIKNMTDKIIESINLFNENKIIDGKIYAASDSTTIPTLADNTSFCCILLNIKQKTNYTYSNYGYYFSYYDADYNYISRSGSPNGSSTTGTLTTPNNAKYVALNVRKTNLENYMFVEGDELPSTYIKYKYTELKNSNYLDKKVFDNFVDSISHVTKEIYNVGDGQEYTSFTQCLRELEGNNNNKIIYVHGGTYDIFEEYGGTDFAQTVSDTDWSKWCVVVPGNTHIIGIGKVVLNYLPTTEQTTSNCAKVISPINITKSCTIENIEIHCSNGRYCIHDETGSTPNTNTKFINVKCYKHSSTFGYVQAYGGGVSYNSSVILENCLFESSYTSSNELIPFSIHNSGGGTTEEKSSYIDIINCIFISSKKYGIRFGNSNYEQNDIRVNISNSYIGGTNGLLITNEYTNENLVNAFNVTLLNCNAINEVIDATHNVYSVKKYNVIN